MMKILLVYLAVMIVTLTMTLIIIHGGHDGDD